MTHPLLAVLLDAADGRFPPADGQVLLLPPLRPGVEAVLSLTGRAYVATRLATGDLADLELHGFGAATDPTVLTRLAGPGGEVGVLDATLVGRGTGGGGLPRRTDLDDHPRVRHARRIRLQVRVFGDERGLVTLSRGLAGRTELSVETTPGSPAGTGRALVRDALGEVPAGEPVFAAVSPGNARSLRAFLALGFVPVGSEVVLLPQEAAGRVPSSQTPGSPPV